MKGRIGKRAVYEYVRGRRDQAQALREDEITGPRLAKAKVKP